MHELNAREVSSGKTLMEGSGGGARGTSGWNYEVTRKSRYPIRSAFARNVSRKFSGDCPATSGVYLDRNFVSGSYAHNGSPDLAHGRKAPALSVHFDLTYRCNERCVHCYLDHDDHGELTTPMLKVLDDLARSGRCFLTFQRR